jgi:hypothetical protein
MKMKKTPIEIKFDRLIKNQIEKMKETRYLCLRDERAEDACVFSEFIGFLETIKMLRAKNYGSYETKI